MQRAWRTRLVCEPVWERARRGEVPTGGFEVSGCRTPISRDLRRWVSSRRCGASRRWQRRSRAGWRQWRGSAGIHGTVTRLTSGCVRARWSLGRIRFEWCPSGQILRAVWIARYGTLDGLFARPRLGRMCSGWIRVILFCISCFPARLGASSVFAIWWPGHWELTCSSLLV